MISRAVVAKRGNRSEPEKPFWISYADLMTALMVLFLVAMSVAMMTVTYNVKDVERQKKELEERNKQLNETMLTLDETNKNLQDEKKKLLDEQEARKTFEAELMKANEQLEKLRKTQKELDDEAATRQRDVEVRQLLHAVAKAADRHPGVKVDEDHHIIDFGDRARFDFSSFALTGDQSRLLREFVPEVLSIANDDLGRKWMKQVVVEGFASPEGEYLYNLHLSLERSERVLCALLAPPPAGEAPLSTEQKEQIRNLFLVGGYSFNAAKFDEGSKSYDASASRRVEFRLEFLGVGEKRPEVVTALHERPGKCRLPE